MPQGWRSRGCVQRPGCSYALRERRVHITQEDFEMAVAKVWLSLVGYTIYNEKYFQKVSFCVITHLIGQNGRAVCKKTW